MDTNKNAQGYDPSALRTLTPTFHEDSGHGWLAVHEDLLARFGLSQADFTQYSYRYQEHVFLEEDCDAPSFIAFMARHGVTVEPHRVYHRGDAPCRSYRRCAPGASLLHVRERQYAANLARNAEVQP